MSFERKSGEAATGFPAHRRQAAVARFLAVLYVFASLIAAGHHHGAPTMTAAQSVHPAAIAHVTNHLDASERDCLVCDFIAHLVSPAAPPAALLTLVLAVVAIASPEKAAAPFFPARFCDRSAARAPPALCA